MRFDVACCWRYDHNVFAGRFSELFNGVCFVYFYSCSGGDMMTEKARHEVLETIQPADSAIKTFAKRFELSSSVTELTG